MKRYVWILSVLVLCFGFGGAAAVHELNKIVFVHLIHPPDGNVHVGDTYETLAQARKAAQLVETNGTNTWVLVSPSRFHEKKEKDKNHKLSNFFQRFRLFEELGAQIILDGTTNTTVSLPAAVRSGEFTSPEVRFTSQFETIVFELFLPVDADWDNPANTIDFQIEYSPDRTPGSWLTMCSSFSTYGSGRPLDKNGVPSTGGHTGCSGRDTNNVLYPVTTWYRMIVTIPNPMTVGGQVTIPI